MTPYRWILALSCVLIPIARAQDIDGFKLGMTKDAVCAFASSHPGYEITGGACPELGDFVVASVPKGGDSIGAQVMLAFKDNAVQDEWTEFPAADFDRVSSLLAKRYGEPYSIYAMTAGSAQIIVGATKRNAEGQISLDPKRSRPIPFPGGGIANFTNFYLCWYKDTTRMFLEEQNKRVNGQMMGWYAIMK